jgi:hypothetical protein
LSQNKINEKEIEQLGLRAAELFNTDATIEVSADLLAVIIKERHDYRSMAYARTKTKDLKESVE